MFLFRNNTKTLRPIKSHKRGTKRYDLHVYSQNTLGSGDIATAVRVPPGEDTNEWLAANCVDFFNEINLVYGAIVEFCTKESCPLMQAAGFKYLWADGVAVKTPIKCSAPEYVDYLLTWVEGQFNDEKLFPTALDTPFPADFKKVVGNICKRLFRVYAHIYHHHWDHIVSIEAERHLNTCFKHFLFFCLEFKLVPDKDLEPMKELIAKFKTKEAKKSAAAATTTPKPHSGADTPATVVSADGDDADADANNDDDAATATATATPDASADSTDEPATTAAASAGGAGGGAGAGAGAGAGVGAGTATATATTTATATATATASTGSVAEDPDIKALVGRVTPTVIVVQEWIKCAPEVAFDNASATETLPDIFKGSGAVPGVKSATMEKDGVDKMTLGETRVVTTLDGKTVRETYVCVDRPSRYAYKMTDLNAPLSAIMTMAVGEWDFVASPDPKAGKGTEAASGVAVTWKYSAFPRASMARPATALVVRVFLKKAMQDCLTQLKALCETGLPPRWAPDGSRQTCQSCEKKFRALTRRRHHCRCCAGLFCSSCSTKRKALPQFGITQAVRVCNKCHAAPVPSD